MKTHPDISYQNCFDIGELVWWTDIKNIGSKNLGIVQAIYKIEKGGRSLWYAEVLCLKAQEIKHILISILYRAK